MLTDLNWISQDKPFPPVAEKERLEAYAQNEKLFLTQHGEVWKKRFARLEFLYRKRSQDIQTVLNYHQLLSKKTADFVCSEPPSIETESGGDVLEKLLDKNRFFSLLYEAVIDVTRYGNGLIKLVGQRATVVSPMHWFPIISPDDLKQIDQHVIAYPMAPDDQGRFTQVRAEIHTPGRVETRIHAYSTRDGTGGQLGPLLSSEASATRLTGAAVFPLSNVTHSSSIYGLDDYAIINGLIEKIMWRLHCADTIMDKHSEPTITGPASALEMDERTGLWLFKAGNYFSRESTDSPDVSYVTWDGNLEANFKELELLLNQLYILSEMGAAFTEGAGGGSTSSGTALKLRLVSPRIKAQRLTGINDAAVRGAIVALAAVNNLVLNENALALTWRDGLPDDPVEDAQRRSVETGGKQTKSQFSAIKERGLSDEETEAELEQIRLEMAANSPALLGVSDPFAEEETGQEAVTNGATA